MPIYPNARRIDHFTSSLLNGGGRHLNTDISDDEPSVVRAWFEAELGPASIPSETEFAWQWRSPGQVVEEVLVSPFEPARQPGIDSLSEEEIAAARTTITYGYHVLPKPNWWQFWKPRW